MKILIINSGSSSIKFQLMDMPAETLICNGLVERIGYESAIITYKTHTAKIEQTYSIKNHKQGLRLVVDLLMDKENGVIANTNEIEVVGHRVVHGGNTFSNTTLITAEVKKKVKDLIALAPLHNPGNLEGILVAEELFPQAHQVAVFDTAFHQTIPVKAKKYAIPNEFYEKHRIQVYGFHGISHQYVTERALAHLQLKSSKIITVHLGNGCSMTAVQDGKSIDHSLGFTPSNGLIMGSRSGDIDHGLVFYLVSKMGYTLDEVKTLVTNQSGMLGLTGHMDLRDIQEAAEKGDQHCILALEMNAYRIKKYIGAYAAAMNGVDAIVFTAGIGENSSVIRQMVCENMDFLGMDMDRAANDLRSSKLREINTAASKVKILVIPTNEELEIAKQSYDLVN